MQQNSEAAKPERQKYRTLLKTKQTLPSDPWQVQFADRRTAQGPAAANWGYADRQLITEPVSMPAPTRDKRGCVQPWVTRAAQPRVHAEWRGRARCPPSRYRGVAFAPI